MCTGMEKVRDLEKVDVIRHKFLQSPIAGTFVGLHSVGIYVVLNPGHVISVREFTPYSTVMSFDVLLPLKPYSISATSVT